MEGAVKNYSREIPGTNMISGRASRKDAFYWKIAGRSFAAAAAAAARVFGNGVCICNERGRWWWRFQTMREYDDDATNERGRGPQICPRVGFKFWLEPAESFCE